MYKKNLYLLTIVLCVMIGCVNRAMLHTITLKDTPALKKYFAYTGEAKMTISGHRGGSKNGYPENSIASMRYTLRYTPATFEIDPRLTKDSVIVLMHDPTLGRMTNGKGKVSDYTWKELKKLRLKGPEGKPAKYHIPTLDEAIRWARGKTILNLDIKDVSKSMHVRKIREHNAESYVIVTVRNARQAKYYYERDQHIMYSAWIKTKEAFKEYDKAVPWIQVVQAYIGPKNNPQKQELIKLLHRQGIKVMVGAGPSYDTLNPKERKQAYQKLIQSNVDIIETDRPIEVAKAIDALAQKGNFQQ